MAITDRQASSRRHRSPAPGAHALLLALTALAGCGGGGSGGTAAVPAVPDTTAPTITGMTPGEDTAVLGTNSAITVTFSEAMVAASINPVTFRLTDGSSAIPGSVAFDAVNRIATFTPDGLLAPGTRYTATVVTGLEDLAGNPLTTDFAWCFVTAGSADVLPPVTTATGPSDAATDFALNQRLSATFSEDMSGASLAAAGFTLTGPDTKPVPGTVTYRGRTAVFMPARSLAANTSYRATLAAGIADLAGNGAGVDASWTFSTRANSDTAPPVAVATAPSSAALAVPIASTISVQLSEPMDPATITTATFTLTDADARPVIGTVAFDPANNTATFTRLNHLTTPVSFHPTPVSDLDPGTTYNAVLDTGALDMAGNPLSAAVAWSFTTAP